MSERYASEEATQVLRDVAEIRCQKAENKRELNLSHRLGEVYASRSIYN